MTTHEYHEVRLTYPEIAISLIIVAVMFISAVLTIWPLFGVMGILLIVGFVYNRDHIKQAIKDIHSCALTMKKP